MSRFAAAVAQVVATSTLSFLRGDLFRWRLRSGPWSRGILRGSRSRSSSLGSIVAGGLVAAISGVLGAARGRSCFRGVARG
jgi:hypothetical protein